MVSVRFQLQRKEPRVGSHRRVAANGSTLGGSLLWGAARFHPSTGGPGCPLREPAGRRPSRVGSLAGRDRLLNRNQGVRSRSAGLRSCRRAVHRGPEDGGPDLGKRPRHQCKEVEKVLDALERAGWTIVYPSGHWGRAECVGGCTIGVPGTPKDCGNAAKRVGRKARQCPHAHAPS